MTTKKICAVCKSRTQSNIIHRWQRDYDRKVFYICGECAEAGKVNKDSVKEIDSEEYKSFMTADEFDTEVFNKVRGLRKGSRKYVTVGEYVKMKDSSK